MGPFRDRAIDPAYSAPSGVMTDARIGAMTAATGARTDATTGATAGMTAATGAPDPDYWGASSTPKRTRNPPDQDGRAAVMRTASGIARWAAM